MIIYIYVIAFRTVKASYLIIVKFKALLWGALGKVTTRIVNEVKGVNRVLYDCTGKPPATIELE